MSRYFKRYLQIYYYEDNYTKFLNNLETKIVELKIINKYPPQPSSIENKKLVKAGLFNLKP